MRPRAPWPLRLYRLALRAYPPAFRRAYADELWQTARDAHEAVRGAGSRAAVVRLWLHIATDLLRTAPTEQISERITSMRAIAAAVRPSVIAAAITTGLACVVAVLASLDLYLLEDQNPLTPIAYQAAPILRFSYDAVYLSALVAGLGVCAILARAIFGPGRAVTLGLGGLALLIPLGGFGGLLLRAPVTFLVLFASYAALAILCALAGQIVAARWSESGPRAAAILGASVGAGLALLANLAALIPHTLALNPVSHPLYMQGQIPGTHLNALLIGLALQLATGGLGALCLIFTLRSHSGATPSPAR